MNKKLLAIILLSIAVIIFVAWTKLIHWRYAETALTIGMIFQLVGFVSLIWLIIRIARRKPNIY